MLDIENIRRTLPALQLHDWPPVPRFGGLAPDFLAFMAMTRAEQARFLAGLRGTSEQHGKILHTFLGIISGYIFGYADSPLFRALDDDLEIDLLRSKIVLERELMAHWLRPAEAPTQLDQSSAVRYLEQLAQDNSSLSHPLFGFIRNRASQTALRLFLRNEAIRNEIVDDEVAMMSAGLQGPMKLAVISNLWDECGRGKLKRFHTYWLRQLLDHMGDWDDIRAYRHADRPWFTGITTNVFNILLTRPGLKYMAYGWFLINESWVAPHFQDIIAGLQRVDITHRDVTIYFDAHIGIDPVHSTELLGAIAIQDPPLTSTEAEHLVRGAHMAIAASTAQYDWMLTYLTDVSAPTPGRQI